MVYYQIQPTKLAKITFSLCLSTSALLIGATSGLTQAITPAPDGTGTLINSTGSQFEIQGGTENGQNLFHHFIQFNPQNQNVNFILQNPEIQNILGRVSGGDVSYINGRIQVTGATANLFLINPAGIIFGENATLAVPSSFTATTATRLRIGENWLNAIGSNDYASLIGTPSEYAFGTANPGVVVNAGNLAVSEGKALSFIGGTVANTGRLTAPAGQITLQAVPGSSLVQMTLPNSSLILEFDGKDLPDSFTPRSLPQLLTGILPVPIQGLQVEDGQVKLTNSNRFVSTTPGSVALGGRLNIAGSQGGGITAAGRSVVIAPDELNTTPTNQQANNSEFRVQSDNIVISPSDPTNPNIVLTEEDLENPDKFPDKLDLILNADKDIKIGTLQIEDLNKFDNSRPSKDVEILKLTHSTNDQLGALTEKPSGSIVFQAGRTFEMSSDSLIAANGRNISIFAGDFIRTGEIRTGNGFGLAGSIKLETKSNSTTAYIQTQGLLANASGTNPITSTPPAFSKGGEIHLKTQGSISVIGNLHNFSTSPDGGGAPIILNAGSDINVTGEIGTYGGNGDVSIISKQGDIQISTVNTSFGGNQVDRSPGSIQIDGYGDIKIQNLWSRDENTAQSVSPASNGIKVISRTGTVDLRGGFVDTGNSQRRSIDPESEARPIQPYSERSAPITILAEKDIYLDDIDISSGGQGGDLTIISKNGSVDTTAGKLFADSNGGSANINVSAQNGNVRLAQVKADGQTAGSNLKIDSRSLQITGNLTVGSKSGDPGNLNLNIVENIQLPEEVSLNRASINSNTPLISLLSAANGSRINTGGGSISLDFASDYTLAPNLTILTNGGDIRLTSTGALTILSDLDTSSLTSNGGSIFLQSGSTITTNDLVSTGFNNGGNISLIAPTSITTNNINSSGANGNGGDVLLDPLQDVQVGWINAQGGNNGVGGNVDIVSIQGFVRATNSFQATNGTNASISTIGGLGGGSITITHNGGNLFIPFNVTNLLQNGTQAVLTTGSETILNGIFPGPYQQGNIGLITSPRFTTLLADSLLDGNPRDVMALDTSGTIFPLEEKFTREFSKDAKVLTLEEMQSTLRKVEENTGVKPALIYVSYASVPTSMPNCTPGTKIPNEQNPGEEKECVCKDVILPSQASPSESSVEYEALPCDRLTLTLVTSTGAPKYFPLSNVPRHQVNERTTQFRNLIIDRIGKKDNRFKSVAHELYSWLAKPLQEHLKKQGIDNLSYLMPDQLRLVPLSATLDEQNRFLIETYSTGLMPSLSLVDTRAVEIKRRNVLAVGLSNFSDSTISPLKHSIEEIEMIPEPWRVKRLKNDQVTFQKLSQADSPGIIHFATHGNYATHDESGNKSSESTIQIWNQALEPQDIKNLGWYNPKPPIELMVLSACDTTLGKSELGFAGSAHYFGAKSVLGTLWKIDDHSTPDLMRSFYTFLNEKPTKASALAEAQKTFVNDYTPFHWAAFTLVGNPW
jgi:filamentous hemagglutinin family protein